MFIRMMLAACAAALAFGLGCALPASAQLTEKGHLYDEGVHALDAQNFLVAESNFNTVLQENPRDVFALMMVGILEVARQDYPDARKHFEFAAKLKPHAPDPIGRLGWVSAKMGDAASARRQRIALEGMNRACQRVHCLNGDAIANGMLMIDSVMTAEDGGGHFFGAGIDAIQAGDWDAADAAFREVLREAPRNPGANFLFGVVRIGQKNYPEARTYLEMAVKLSPRMPDPIGRLGWVDVQLGDFDAARKERSKLETMRRNCKKTCFDSVTIDRGLWMINGVLPSS